ncbi:MAG: RNA-dependent RNA polymerase [Wenzhou bat rhabdovirus 1]|nr:MAG: RNA-dependent RNA polymerase [Wenzhou bat rhabdovirus 1]WPV62702.1 MAG: RNA-dependent RNA polymerase [Wenzhou bat rhabdovirus 1]WPV62708.1 MAG: RNA-dependent RNA polymerase [Wenzhou bat rhabdovirus 1]
MYDFFGPISPTLKPPNEKPYPDYHLQSPLNLEKFRRGIGKDPRRKQQADLLRKTFGGSEITDKDIIIGNWISFMKRFFEMQIGVKEMDWPKVPSDVKSAISQYVSNVTLGPNADSGELVEQIITALNQDMDGRHTIPVNYLSCILRRMVEWRNHSITTSDIAYPTGRLNEVGLKKGTKHDNSSRYISWSFCCHEHFALQLEGRAHQCCPKHILTMVVTMDIFAFQVDGHVLDFVPIDFLLCWADTLESRTLMYRLSTIESKILQDVLSSAELDELYQIGDDILLNAGNNGYSIIKLLEPLCLGEVQCRLNKKHGLEGNDIFYETMKTELFSLCQEGILNTCANRLVTFISKLSSLKVLEVFGTFRHWGHPFLEVTEGLRNLKLNARKIKVINASVMRELESDCEQILLKHYYSKYNAWPDDASVNWIESPILARCIKANRWPTLDERRRIGTTWLFVKHGPLFDIPDIIPVDILIDDKAHSGQREEVVKLINRAKAGRLTTASRRVILTTLKSESVDIRKELARIDEHGLEEDDLIIGLKGKERELKVEGRFFSLMSFRLRLYFVATEWMLGKYIVPLFREITMMDSGPELMRKLSDYTRGSYNPTDRKTVTFAIHLDYSKWNAHQRYESTAAVFRVIDQALGYKTLIAQTHKIFQKCVYYYADALDMITKLGADECYTWSNHLGGIEGLRQKGWSIVGALLLRKVSREFNQPFNLLIQGDNQVVILRYETELIPDDPEYKNEINRLLDLTKSILNRICEVSGQIGLITKKEETWIAYGLLIYGKYPILEGIGVGIYSKRVSRMYTSSNEKIPSIQNALSTITTTGLTIAQLTSGILIPIALSYYMMYISVRRFMDYDPCLGEGIKKILSGPLTVDGSITIPKVERHDLIIFDILTRDTILGGLGGGSPGRFLVRQFPDPLNESLASIKCGCFGLAEPFKKVMIKQGYPVFSPVKNWKNLVEDPTSLNLYSGSNIRTVIRNIVSRSMSYGVNTWIQEKALKEALTLRDQLETSIVEKLMEWEPVLPNLLCNMYEASLLGQVNNLINRFDGTRTLVDKAFSESSGQIYKRIRGAYKKSIAVYRIHFESNREEYPLWACSYEHSLKLQEESWGRKLLGVRVPHPIEQFELIPQTSVSCDACAHPGLSSDKILFLLNSKVLRTPNAINSLGPGTAYLGSSTTEHKATLKQVAAKSTETIVQKALAVTKCLNWFVSPSSNVAKSIMNLISSLCDYPTDQFPVPAPKLSGDVLHRYSSNRMAHGGFSPISYGPLTNIFQNSNLLNHLHKGGENRLIVFQAVFLSMSVRIISRVQAGLCPAPAYHAHPKCLTCLPMCERVWIDDEKTQIIEWPSTKDKASGSVFYALGGINLITSVPRALISTVKWEHVPTTIKKTWTYFTLAYLVTEDYWQSPYHDVQVGSIYSAPLIKYLDYAYWIKHICITLILREAWISAHTQGDQVTISYSNLKYRALEKMISFQISTSAMTHCHNEHFLTMMSNHSGLTPKSYPPKTEEIIDICQADIATTLKDLTPVDILEEFPSDSLGPYFFPDVNEWSFTQRVIICLTYVLVHLRDGESVTLFRNNLKELFTGHRPRVPWVADGMYKPVNTIFDCCSPSLFDLRLKDVAEDLIMELGKQSVECRYEKELIPRAKASYLMIRGLRPDPLLNAKSASLTTTPLSHFIRQSGGSTTAESKLRSILQVIPKSPGGWIVCGDGSGGYTAVLTERGDVEYVIFNTLPDYEGAGEQSLGSALPPALIGLPEECKKKIWNLDRILEVDQDLKHQGIYDYWKQCLTVTPSSLTGVICDAETYDDQGWLQIFRNLNKFRESVDSSLTMIIKGHLNQIKRLMDNGYLASEELARYDFLRSPYSQWGNTEVYLYSSSDPTFTEGPFLHIISMMQLKCTGTPRVQLSEFHRLTKRPLVCVNQHQLATLWSKLLKDIGVRSHKVIYPREFDLLSCLTSLYTWTMVGYLKEVRQYKPLGVIGKLQGLHLSDVHNLCGLQCALTCLISALIGDYMVYQQYAQIWDSGLTHYDTWEFSGGLIGILQDEDGKRQTRWQRKKPVFRAFMNLFGMMTRPDLTDRDSVHFKLKEKMALQQKLYKEDLYFIPKAKRGYLQWIS